MTTEGITLGIIIGVTVAMLLMTNSIDKQEPQWEEVFVLPDSTSVDCIFTMPDSMLVFSEPIDIIGHSTGHNTRRNTGHSTKHGTGQYYE